MRRFNLKSLENGGIAIGACVLCLMGLVALVYFQPTVTPPDKVVLPAASTPIVPSRPSKVAPAPAPAPAPLQESPQEPQESPDGPQGNLSPLDTPTLAPPLPVLPVPPANVIEMPVEVIVEPVEVIIEPEPAPSCSGGICPSKRYYPRRRRWLGRH